MAGLWRTFSQRLYQDPDGETTEREGRSSLAYDDEDISTAKLSGRGKEEDAKDDESDAGSEDGGLDRRGEKKLNEEEYDDLLARAQQDGFPSLGGQDLLLLFNYQSQIQHSLQIAAGAYLLRPRAGRVVIKDITKVLRGTIIWNGDAVRKMDRTLKMGDPHVLPSHNGAVCDRFRPAMFFNHIGGKSVGYTLHRYSKRGLGALTKERLRSGIFVVVINDGEAIPVHTDVPNLCVLRVVGGNKLATPCVMEMIEKELFITDKSRTTATTLHPDDYDKFLAAKDAYHDTGNSEFSAAASIAKIRHALRLSASTGKLPGSHKELTAKKGRRGKEDVYKDDADDDREAERADDLQNHAGITLEPRARKALTDDTTNNVAAQAQHQSHDGVQASPNNNSINIHTQSTGGALNVVTGDHNRISINDNTQPSPPSEQLVPAGTGPRGPMGLLRPDTSTTVGTGSTAANSGMRARGMRPSTGPTLQSHRNPLSSMASNLSHQTLGTRSGRSKRGHEGDTTPPRSIRARMDLPRERHHGGWDGRGDGTAGSNGTAGGAQEDRPSNMPKASKKSGRHSKRSERYNPEPKTLEQLDDELDEMVKKQ